MGAFVLHVNQLFFQCFFQGQYCFPVVADKDPVIQNGDRPFQECVFTKDEFPVVLLSRFFIL